MKNLRTKIGKFETIQAEDQNGLHLQDDGGNGIFIKDGGNVGIGTTNPGPKLDVVGGNIRVGKTSNGQFIGENNSATQTIKLDTDGVSYLNGGHVGIGTRNPGNQLHVSVNSDDEYDASSYSSAALQIENTNTAASSPHSLIHFRLDKNGGDGYLGFITDGITANTQQFVLGGHVTGECLRVASNGHVGIGTTNPGGQLQIYSTTKDEYQLIVEGTHGSSGWGGLSSFRFTLEGTDPEVTRYLGLGAYRPTEGINPCGVIQFQSRDSGSCWLWMDDANVLRFGTNSSNIGGTGGAAIGTAGTSDERLKNIEDDFEYGLSHVLQLQPIAFTFKNDKEAVRKLGFGAQTSQSIIPESVYDSGNCIDGYDDHPEHEGMNVPKSDDNELGMEYVQLIPVLTKAIQEQQQIIEALKSQNESLAAQNADFESRISQLEQ